MRRPRQARQAALDHIRPVTYGAPRSSRRTPALRTSPRTTFTRSGVVETGASDLSGEGGIRTLDGRNRPYRFSRPAHSTALPPLRSAQEKLATRGEDRGDQRG